MLKKIFKKIASQKTASKAPATPFFTVENTDTDIFYKKNDTLLDALLNSGIEVDHSCGGMGACGTCKVFISHGLEALPPRNSEEIERAQDLSFTNSERLSCQIHPCNGLKIRIP